MPATYAGDITGYPRHLYHDWPKQYHACHGISQESNAHVYGNGSLQHNPRSHFIFQFDWGIRGAATATVISQFIGMVWVVSHFLQKTSVVRLQRGFWKMKKRIISSILSIGMSPFLMNVTACVIVIIVKQQAFNSTEEIWPSGIWHYQPTAGTLCNDCIGADDGNATDCRL